MFNQSNIKYTDYIRTTEARHRMAVENVWNELFRRGFIYKSTYSGWYSVNDEAFLKDNQVGNLLIFLDQFVFNVYLTWILKDRRKSNR